MKGPAMERLDGPKCLQNLGRFKNSLEELVELSELDLSPTCDVCSISGPLGGAYDDWIRRKELVDRAALASSREFEAAHVILFWKPPGSWDLFPASPSGEWATVLSACPKFDLTTLFGAIETAMRVFKTLHEVTGCPVCMLSHDL